MAAHAQRVHAATQRGGQRGGEGGARGARGGAAVEQIGDGSTSRGEHLGESAQEWRRLKGMGEDGGA